MNLTRVWGHVAARPRRALRPARRHGLGRGAHLPPARRPRGLDRPQPGRRLLLARVGRPPRRRGRRRRRPGGAAGRRCRPRGLRPRPCALGTRRRVDPNGITAADLEPLRRAGFDDRQIFAITTFVALRLAFSTINDALGAQPDRQLVDDAPAVVREGISSGRRRRDRGIGRPRPEHGSTPSLRRLRLLGGGRDSRRWGARRSGRHTRWQG